MAEGGQIFEVAPFPGSFAWDRSQNPSLRTDEAEPGLKSDWGASRWSDSAPPEGAAFGDTDYNHLRSLDVVERNMQNGVCSGCRDAYCSAFNAACMRMRAFGIFYSPFSVVSCQSYFHDFSPVKLGR